MYVIIYLDLGSDDNGIQDAFGPYEDWWEASGIADVICLRTGLRRGVDIQVASVRPKADIYDLEPNF